VAAYKHAPVLHLTQRARDSTHTKSRCMLIKSRCMLIDTSSCCVSRCNPHTAVRAGQDVARPRGQFVARQRQGHHCAHSRAAWVRGGDKEVDFLGGDEWSRWSGTHEWSRPNRMLCTSERPNCGLCMRRCVSHRLEVSRARMRDPCALRAQRSSLSVVHVDRGR